jgi:hypothetical protein
MRSTHLIYGLDLDALVARDARMEWLAIEIWEQ